MKTNSFRISLFLILFMLFSCAIDKGKPVIPEDKMVEILTDYYLTQASVSDYILPKGETKVMYYCGVLDRHGVSEAEFDSAVSWYTKNFDVYETVYERVLANLTAKRDSVEKTIPTTP